MEQRQVEFLRRRYAAAILGDDADTACRLRARLDGIMNPTDRLGSALPPQSSRPEADLSPGPARGAPRLQLVTPVTPVTGLLETPRPLARAARAG
jgi:hypothetical protein